MERALRDAWWLAVAALARVTGDVGLAEDSVQEACAQALLTWPSADVPANPTGWLVAVARRRAVDQMRREAARSAKEWLAVQELSVPRPGDDGGIVEDDQLALLFACCHPAFDPGVRITLTLRVVCGVPTAAIARLLLLPEATVDDRLESAATFNALFTHRVRLTNTRDIDGEMKDWLAAAYTHAK